MLRKKVAEVNTHAARTHARTTHFDADGHAAVLEGKRKRRTARKAQGSGARHRSVNQHRTRAATARRSHPQKSTSAHDGGNTIKGQ